MGGPEWNFYGGWIVCLYGKYDPTKESASAVRGLAAGPSDSRAPSLRPLRALALRLGRGLASRLPNHSRGNTRGLLFLRPDLQQAGAALCDGRHLAVLRDARPQRLALQRMLLDIPDDPAAALYAPRVGLRRVARGTRPLRRPLEICRDASADILLINSTRGLP